MNEPYLNIPIAGFRADCCIQRIKAFPTDSFSFTPIEEGVDLKKKKKANPNCTVTLALDKTI